MRRSIKCESTSSKALTALNQKTAAAAKRGLEPGFFVQPFLSKWTSVSRNCRATDWPNFVFFLLQLFLPCFSVACRLGGSRYCGPWRFTIDESTQSSPVIVSKLLVVDFGC